MSDITKANYIYKITNIINNKIYICLYRYKTTNGFVLNKKYIKDDFKKYGIGNFKYEFLEYVTDKNKAQRKKYWINKFKSNIPGIGYNLRVKGEKHPLYGKKHTNETRKKMSIASKKAHIKKGRKVYNLTAGHKEKLHEAKTNSKKWQAVINSDKWKEKMRLGRINSKKWQTSVSKKLV